MTMLSKHYVNKNLAKGIFTVRPFCLNAVHGALKNGMRTVDIARGQGQTVSTAAMGEAIAAIMKEGGG